MIFLISMCQYWGGGVWCKRKYQFPGHGKEMLSSPSPQTSTIPYNIIGH